MLKKIRIALAALFFVGITLLLAGIGADALDWMAQIQFLPSLMRVIGSATLLNVAVLCALVLLTLLLGRIYCSVICPLGVWQDIVNWISSRRKGKKRRFHFKPERVWLRDAVWVLYVAALFAGIQVAIALLAPYSAWGRIVQSVLHPVGMGWAVVAVAAVTLIATGLLAWLGGRTYCNTICPVGTTLGIFSRFELFGPTIDAAKCTGCKSCERQCKSSCIDIAHKKIDYGRCVSCYDCISDCKFGAMRLGNTWKSRPSRPAPAQPDTDAKNQPAADVQARQADVAQSRQAADTPESATVDSGKRAFLSATALALGAVTLKAQEQKLDGGLAALEAKKKPVRTERIVPPGAQGIKEFYARCTACQLCVSQCPNGVLHPSTDLQHLMQPEASYEHGYCRPECTACADVCPSGAILPLTPEEKTVVHIGTATVDYDLCVVNRDGVSCGNCARHCPAEAITMVPGTPGDPLSPKIPSVVESKCIGCGACEYLCPSRPYSAIHVNGLKEHIHG